MSSRPWLAGVFVPAVLLSGACGGGAAKTAVTPGVSGDTIYVGALTPLSDPVAVIGRPLLRGQQLYFDRLNTAGGIGGRYQVKILEEDITYANPSTGAQKYQKIKSDVALIASVVGTDQVRRRRSDCRRSLPRTGSASPKLAGVRRPRCGCMTRWRRAPWHRFRTSARSGLSFPTAGSAVDLLAMLAIARELTGKRRNRVFVYDRYLAILNEGAEP